MRELVLALDALPALREATGADLDLAAAAKLAELAGVDAVRLGVREELRPVGERDVRAARGAARALELRMPASPSLVKIALGARPDRVVLAVSGPGGRPGPLELGSRGAALPPVLRALREAGIPVAALVAPQLEAVKIAHAEGAPAVEFFTGAIVDLPGAERESALAGLGDAVRMAAKLRLEVALGGGLGYRNLRDVLRAAPAAQRVAVGRAAISRALLVGLDTALRDLRSLLA
jgi:pyridoxine 5-phosphate synthase